MILLILAGVYSIIKRKISISRNLILTGRQAIVFGISIIILPFIITPILNILVQTIFSEGVSETAGSLLNLTALIVIAVGVAALTKRFVKP